MSAPMCISYGQAVQAALLGPNDQGDLQQIGLQYRERCFGVQMNSNEK